MSIGERLFGLAARVLTKLVSREAKRELGKLRLMEAELSRRLAADLSLPPSAVVVTVHPVPKVELKARVTKAQIAQVQEFLGRLSDTPEVNSKTTSGLN